ncbi:uncharacterized protein LOC125829031 [Solanum verrucosum]|uniref:uncharacterized protein LOC125829031 n=1 Tax=Solanum verrucosum TaxID=315347 RepID=UPI0020D026ED|nr:uncharacterized protein LOC125829031 [Solanum verrucosum]
MLHGWVIEKRQHENGSGVFDMYYYHKSKQYRSIVEVRKYVFMGLSKLEVDPEATEVKEVGAIKKHSMKRKAEDFILKRKSETKKQKSNNHGKREVKKFLGEAMNNLMNRYVKHKNKKVQLIVGGLGGDDNKASNGANGGSNEGGRCHRDDSGRI